MKNFYKSNTFLAIISVISAIIIWIYVVYEVNPLYETWVENVPVQCINVSSRFEDGSLVVVGENSKILKEGLTVDVKIKGKRNVVSTVSKKDLTCTLDMITINGRGQYTIKPDVQPVKSGVDIIKVSPLNFRISAEDIEQMDIKVSIKKKGEIASGYTIDNIKNHNDVVKITGPDSIINRVETAEVVLDLSEIDTKTTETALMIEFKDKNGKAIDSQSVKRTVEYAKISYDIFRSEEVTVLLMPKYKDEVTKNRRGETVKLAVDSENAAKDGGIRLKVKIKGKATSVQKYMDSVQTVYTEEIDVSGIYENKTFEKIAAGELSGDVEYEKVPEVKVKATVQKNKE